MTTLSKKQFTCMLCGSIFVDDVLERSGTIDGQDSDFRLHVTGLQPLAHMIHSCPRCGCLDYTHAERLSEEQKKSIEAYLQASRQAHTTGPLSQVEKYETLAGILTVLHRPDVDIAEAYLKAAWSAEDAGDTDNGSRFREQALGCYVRALAGESVSPMEIPVVTYLVGELHRRLGRFDEALQWFDNVDTRDKQLEALRCCQQDLACQKNSATSRIPKAS
jgi:uncharacterized protein (DUF2225 family)